MEVKGGGMVVVAGGYNIKLFYGGPPNIWIEACLVDTNSTLINRSPCVFTVLDSNESVMDFSKVKGKYALINICNVCRTIFI